jgi:hypothetical protein
VTKLERRFRESTPDEIRETKAALDKYTKDANAPAHVSGQPGKLRTWSKIWLAGLVVCGIPIATASAGPLVFIAGIASVVGAAITTVPDLLSPSARARRSPEQALRCYLRSVKIGHWKAAHAALGDPARNESLTVPRIQALRSERVAASMATPEGVERYWKGLVRPSQSMWRQLAGFWFQPLDHTGDVRRFRVKVKIHAFHQIHAFMLLFGILPGILVIYLFFMNRFTSEYEVTLFKHESQWWLASGKLGLPERSVPLPAAKVVKRKQLTE